jgi:hypothetical protein
MRRGRSSFTRREWRNKSPQCRKLRSLMLCVNAMPPPSWDDMAPGKNSMSKLSACMCGKRQRLMRRGRSSFTRREWRNKSPQCRKLRWTLCPLIYTYHSNVCVLLYPVPTELKSAKRMFTPSVLKTAPEVVGLKVAIRQRLMRRGRSSFTRREWRNKSPQCRKDDMAPGKNSMSKLSACMCGKSRDMA